MFLFVLKQIYRARMAFLDKMVYVDSRFWPLTNENTKQSNCDEKKWIIEMFNDICRSEKLPAAKTVKGHTLCWNVVHANGEMYHTDVWLALYYIYLLQLQFIQVNG